MSQDSDAGLIKRGLILLLVMLLIVTTVLLIMFQGPSAAPPTASARAQDYAWSVALPGAPFPANVSWGALQQLSEHLPSPVGWEIRFNAAVTLARRGSDHVPWGQIQAMLDVQRATVNVRAQTPNATEPPEPTAHALVVATLKAIADWHTIRRGAGKTEAPAALTEVYQTVDTLAASPIPEIRDQAQKTQATFFRT